MTTILHQDISCKPAPGDCFHIACVTLTALTRGKSLSAKLKKSCEPWSGGAAVTRPSWVWLVTWSHLCRCNVVVKSPESCWDQDWNSSVLRSVWWPGHHYDTCWYTLLSLWSFFYDPTIIIGLGYKAKEQL